MKKLLLLAFVLVMGTNAFAQIENPVHWAYAAKRISPTEAVVFIRATMDDKWHIYSLNVKDGGPIKTSFTFTASKEYQLIGSITEPKPLSKYEPSFSMTVTYFEKSVTFQQKIKLKKNAQTVVKGSLEFETCNDRKCLNPTDVDFSIPIPAK